MRTTHSLVWIHRPKPHVHRYQATCSCGGFRGVPTRRKREAEKQYRHHVTVEEKRARTAARQSGSRNPYRRPLTAVEALPEDLR